MGSADPPGWPDPPGPPESDGPPEADGEGEVAGAPEAADDGAAVPVAEAGGDPPAGVPAAGVDTAAGVETAAGAERTTNATLPMAIANRIPAAATFHVIGDRPPGAQDHQSPEPVQAMVPAHGVSSIDRESHVNAEVPLRVPVVWMAGRAEGCPHSGAPGARSYPGSGGCVDNPLVAERAATYRRSCRTWPTKPTGPPRHPSSGIL